MKHQWYDTFLSKKPYKLPVAEAWNHSIWCGANEGPRVKLLFQQVSSTLLPLFKFEPPYWENYVHLFWLAVSLKYYSDRDIESTTG